MIIGVNRMKGISDLRIIGIDETRPPTIRKEPYIDIFFKLSHQAPNDWCKDLNYLFSQQVATANSTIAEKEGTFIKTWVRTADEILSLVEHLKTTISECTQQYIERIQLASQQSGNRDSTQSNESSEQANLNKIISSINFEDNP